MAGKREFERTDLLFALQYAADEALRTGDREAAAEITRTDTTDTEELRRTFDIALLLVAGLERRAIRALGV